jgi:hypothetical protein
MSSQQFRNSFSKLESPVFWDLGAGNSSCYHQEVEDERSALQKDSMTVVFSQRSASTPEMDSTDSQDPYFSSWAIPFVNSSDFCFHPELSLIRSVCPERKIPARCAVNL